MILPARHCPCLYLSNCCSGSNGDLTPVACDHFAQWWGEAQHGVCQSPSVKFQAPTPYGTSFPEPGLTGATFDKELFSTVGDIIGKEGRAMANAGNAGLTFWAPVSLECLSAKLELHSLLSLTLEISY